MEHQPLKTLQQRVVQFACDSGSFGVDPQPASESIEIANAAANSRRSTHTWIMGLGRSPSGAILSKTSFDYMVQPQGRSAVVRDAMPG